MHCQFCSQTFDKDSELLCTACARHGIYLPRLEYAQLLIDKSKLNKQVEEQTLHPTNSSVWHRELSRVDVFEIRRRIDDLKQKQVAVRQEKQELDEIISGLKHRIGERRAALRTINKTVDRTRETILSQMFQAQNEYDTTARQLQHKSALNRAFLCREVAVLMRLKQRKRQKAGSVRETTSLAGLALPDLKEINTMKCIELTAVLQNVAHLAVLVAFYLGVRIPAEIVLPSRTHPQTQINTPAHSYLEKRVNASEETRGKSSSPTASRYDSRSLAGPRSLHCGTHDETERLSQLINKDPLAFTLFIDATALLAWNVAWLNRSQGILSGTSTWEEICDIGKNLHRLLLTKTQSPSATRVGSEQELAKKRTQRTRAQTLTQDLKKGVTSGLGQSSHLAAYGNLNSHELAKSMQTWQYSTFTRISSSLRNALLNEMNNAEWELLQEQEWDDGGEDFDQAVMVKTRNTDVPRYEDARSIMTVKTRGDESDAGSGRVPGTSGWTKLKSRDKT